MFDGSLTLFRLAFAVLVEVASFFGASTLAADTVRTVVLLAAVFLAVVFF